jgi:hypothetical protein
MTPDPFEAPADVPEADLLDQLAPVDPSDEEPDPEPLSTAAEPVSEVDWVEQQRAVPLDDEPEETGAEQ